MIHVHQDRSVKRMSRQPRIVRLTETVSDVLQSETTHPIAKAPQIFWHDIFCNDAPVGSDDRRQPHDVVAAACADVRDGHPGLDAEETHELVWFAGGVPLNFGKATTPQDGVCDLLHSAAFKARTTGRPAVNTRDPVISRLNLPSLDHTASLDLT